MLRWFFLALAIQMACVFPIQAQVRYQVVDLGVPDPAGILVESGVHNARVTHVSATGINEHGVVVGSYFIEYDFTHNGQIVHNSVRRSFVWQNGQFTDIGALLHGAQYTGSTGATDINEHGVVVGNSDLGRMEPQPHHVYHPSHAFRWSGAMTDLGTGTEVYHGSIAHAVNNNGIAVGATGSVFEYAAKWESGAAVLLPGLLPSHIATAYGVNDAGSIVGNSVDGIVGRGKAVLWRPGQNPENLDPTPLNMQQSEAVDINEQGRIVGAVMPGNAWLPVRWDNGQLAYLFAAPGGGARPAAVNNLGHVVGSMRYSSGRSVAFLWTDALFDPGLMSSHYDLESMIPPNTGWELWGATDINDRGYIVGGGRRNGAFRAFLLIPQDDPTADIDADSNRDGVIDDQDDPIERDIPGAVVAPNIDDSNGDGTLDSDNAVIDGDGDRAQLSKLIVRRPSTVAPSLVGEARLKLISGPGIRVFIDDPAGRVILDPTQSQGSDFWAELAAGDVTLLAEGVERGDLLLELEIIVNGNRHTDTIALNVPGFALELHADEPFLDFDGDAFATGFLEVPADFRALDYQSIESGGMLNLYARLYRDDELESKQVPPERDVKWKVEPIGANQAATLPGLRDLLAGHTDFQPEITARARGHVSRSQLRFSFPHPTEIDPATSQPRPWVKAGDEFKVTATVELPAGRTLQQERFIRIVPGDKYFHVTEPPAGVQPDVLWRLSDGQFEQQFSTYHFEPPLASGQSRTLTALLLDQYRNPLAAGTAVQLRLEGSGYLGALDTSADTPDSETPSEATVGPGGRVEIRMTQTTFASCPWQPEPELEDGAGIIGLFASRVDPLARSMVKRDEAFPPALGRVRLQARHGTITPGFLTPDIHRRETRDFEVRLYRESSSGDTPLTGVQLEFSSVNGKLLAGQDTKTDNSGIARVTLTYENARPDEEILVIASLGTESVVVSYPNMRWLSSAPTVVKPQHRLLAGDKTSDGMLYVETLDDTGEALVFPGEQEGDNLLAVRYRARSRVDVTGMPGHVYKVDLVDSVSWLLSARYPFDQASGQTTPDVHGARDADYTNAVLDLNEKADGTGSFSFNGNSTVTVPGSPAVDLANGLLIELWANPAEHRGALLDRGGQYRLELIGSGPQAGHVRLHIEGVNPQGQPVTHDLVSSQPLPPNRWSFIEARYDGTSIRLGVGAEKDRLDMAFRTFPAVRSIPASTPVLAGAGYAGRMDDLRFTTGGHARALALAAGLSPDGTIATDQNGRAHFFVESTGNWDPDQYRPALLVVELSGSQKAAGGIQITHSSIIGQMINGGKAFLLGTESLGRDAHWFARASAWASENLPLLSDLRTLAMELYKAGSGCDAVSKMNVTFAAVGIIADAATFGSAGAAVRGMAATLKVVTKAFLKEFAKNTAMAALAQAAISAYVRELTLQTAAAGQGNPPGWVLRSHQFMTSLTGWAQQGLSDVLNNSIASLHNMLSWNVIYLELGEESSRQLLESVRTLGAQLEMGTP